MATAVVGSIAILIVVGLFRAWDAFKTSRRRAWKPTKR